MPLKMPFISLRLRFMALAVLLTLGSSFIWGIWAWQRERAFLFERMTREAEVLTSSMAIPIINALLYEELEIIKEGGLLDNFVAVIMANQQLRPRYAMVLDTSGRVLAHNRFAEYGNYYNDPLSRRALTAEGFSQTTITAEGERICDFAIPLAIAGKRWGALRVGVSLEPVYLELHHLTRQIFLFALAFSVGALVIYWIIGTLLARPIVSLTRHMEKVGDPDLPAPFSKFRRDEIGLLQKSFAEMVERLKKSEAERQASIVRMLENERIAAVGRITSGVAHEVNNPLAGIEGALYQIEQKGGNMVQRYTNLIRQSIERIGRIVSQLSDLSRVGTIDTRPVKSKEFFEDLALFAKMALKDREGEIDTFDLCPPTTLVLDRDKIHQVVLNLVLNASDATGPQGKIILRGLKKDGWYVFEVEDNGPGIPAEIAEQVFGPFFTTKEPSKGSGMGLTISRGIVEKHGGSLEYHPGEKGALFLLKIPLPQALESHT